MSYVYFMNTNVELLTRQAARDLAKQYGQSTVPIIRNNADWYTRRTTFFKYDEETAHLTGDFGNPPRNFFTPVTQSDDMHCDSMHGIYQRAGCNDPIDLPTFEHAIRGLVQDQRDQLPYEAFFLKRCALAFCNRVLCTVCDRHYDKCECDGIGKLPVTKDPSGIESCIVVSTSMVPPGHPLHDSGVAPVQEGNPERRAHGLPLSGVRSEHTVDHGDLNCPGEPTCFRRTIPWSDDEDLCPTCGISDDEDGWSGLGQEDQQAIVEDPQYAQPQRRMIRPTEAARLVADQRIFKDWETIPVYSLQTEDKFSYIENYLIK